MDSNDSKLLRLVEELNDIGFGANGEARASVTMTGSYSDISWGDIVLWDSEGNFRLELDVDDEWGWEPSLEVCLFVLREEMKRLNALADGMLRGIEANHPFVS